ncbi:uncharacterized protein LOC119673287 [Teleopsis dalmanni]|uniref:uncharacterized protein LOC119673287 n=1 Tax=Teleopsis dalmanni TaxID=139649 RepID=UPI0018CD98BE|nr:uncharacterized protein LOC119673287 [Teleopsis dalmanni]
MDLKAAPTSIKKFHEVYGVVQIQIKKFDVPQFGTKTNNKTPTSSSSKNSPDEKEYMKNRDKVLRIINEPQTGSTSKLLTLNSQINYLSKTQGYTYTIPFVIRSTYSYCPAEIFESLLLGDVLKYINSVMYKEQVPAILAKPGEVKALSQYMLWKKIIIPDECKIIVELEDVKHFYRYIEYCLTINRKDFYDNNCGFLRINDVHVVPYISRDEECYVSAFFLDEKRFQLRNYIVVLTDEECLYMRANFIIMNKESYLHEVAFAINLKHLGKIFSYVIAERYIPREVRNFNMWDKAHAKDYERLSWCDLKKINAEIESHKEVDDDENENDNYNHKDVNDDENENNNKHNDVSDDENENDNNKHKDISDDENDDNNRDDYDEDNGDDNKDNN